MNKIAQQKQRETILRLEQQGLTQIQIAEHLGINRGSVASALITIRGRKKRKPPNIDEYTLKNMRELAAEGVSQDYLAQRHGYTQSAVSQALRR